MKRSMKMPSGAVVNWELSVNFIEAGKHWFDYGKNTIKISSGINDPSINTAANIGSVVFTLNISHNHRRQLKVGIRQAAKCDFSTVMFAGFKEEDGSIVSSTAGDLNATWQIDASPNSNGVSPNTPYMQTPKQIPSSGNSPLSHIYQVADEPSSIISLMRTNAKTKKYNYLISQNRKEQFLTVAFIEDIGPTGSATPIPLEARTWRYEVDLQLIWEDGMTATGATGKNKLVSIDAFSERIHAVDGFSRINVSNPSPTDNMVKMRGDAANAAFDNETSNARYEYSIYETYHADVRLKLAGMSWPKKMI